MSEWLGVAYRIEEMMSALIAQIQDAQRNAGEQAVIAHLEANGLSAKSDAEKLADAKLAANDLLNAAERAWYAYAGLCDLGPTRIKAFEVYENVRHARRV